MNVLISIIIPCFNAERFIIETLKSVFAQTLQAYEIIVIDDGSTDKTLEIVRSYEGKLRYESGPNRGASAARDRGTVLANGNYIQYLDADDLLTPDALEKKCHLLETTQADVVYMDWQKMVEQVHGSFVQAEIIARKMEDVHVDPEIAHFTDFWAPPAAYLFRAEIIRKVGGWSKTLPIIQDARFALDCAYHGAKFVHCPGVGAYYRVPLKNSLSRGNPIKFVRDCFQNAAEVQSRWRMKGELSREHEKALLKVYGYVSRTSFERDRETFDQACGALLAIDPKYSPEKPKMLRTFSQLFGYRRAEILAFQYRRIKRWLHRNKRSYDTKS